MQSKFVNVLVKACLKVQSNKGKVLVKWQTMDDIMNDTPIDKLKTYIACDSFETCKKQMEEESVVWKESKQFPFNGYWYDKKQGEAFIPVKNE